nr:uncharacterized protein LOC117991019 isoform X1 [Maniola hyperantus]
MKIVISVYLLCFFVDKYSSLISMTEKECLHNEIHKSCAFYEEYTCWETEAMESRVKASPKRLAHCRAGCYCKKGLVRMYPQGKCIIAQACRDLQLRGVLEKIPAEFSNVW